MKTLLYTVIVMIVVTIVVELTKIQINKIINKEE